MKFTKMNGCGNDYVYFNCFEQEIRDPEKLAVHLSDRHFGIGADGIVLICPSQIADAQMRMFNADGSEGMMCGNAIRCVGKYLYDNKMTTKETITIETRSGIKTLNLFIKSHTVEHVRVDMGQAQIGAINRPIVVNSQEYMVTTVSIGNPHCVVFFKELNFPIEELGRCFENHMLFPDRVNTEFVKIVDRTTLEMRVWERGSGETLACGTGACAAVVAAIENGLCDNQVKVKLLGGELIIEYIKPTVIMTGPATRVFDGEL